MHPAQRMHVAPQQLAVVMAGSGETITYGELGDRANRLSRLWWDAGLRRGDHVAVLLENHPRFFEAYWAAMTSGLYFTPISRALTAAEAAYIVEDSGSRALISSTALGDLAEALLPLVPDCDIRLMVDGTRAGYEPYEDRLAEADPTPLDERPLGDVMFYSSGTTGRPKGVWRPLVEVSADDFAWGRTYAALFPLGEDPVYLATAPLYHSAALGFPTGILAMGGTVVVLEKFDGELALQAIERHQVTVSQWVPTMFTRLLKLPEEARTRYDLSSHRVALHGAAPCPVQVKRDMIDWWGPILVDYYGATEMVGLTMIDSQDWLTHPGSVGRPVFGIIHICDDDGNEVPVGEDGLIYFERKRQPFHYHNDGDKTDSARHQGHRDWSTVGDVGHVDEEGYLYLTDRKTFMIISGGVNIYPAESENVLMGHPSVMDVAVIGVPHPEMGEEVKAIVQVVAGVDASDELAAELIAFCRDRLSHVKCPRSVDFHDQLPRLTTGKLYKKALRDRYWSETPLAGR